MDKRLTAKHLLVFLLAASLTGCTESVPVPENTKTAEAKEQKEVEKKTEEADDRSAETTETDMNQRTEMNASHGQSDEYIFPESTEDIISYENIVNKSDEELRLGRNEIFARHGRIFASPDLQTYFEGKSMYTRSVTWSFRERLRETEKHTDINMYGRNLQMERCLRIHGIKDTRRL